jgi:hypothetical protein
VCPSSLTEQTSRLTPKTDGPTGGTTLLWIKLYFDLGSEWKRNYRHFKSMDLWRSTKTSDLLMGKTEQLLQNLSLRRISECNWL